MEQHKESQEQQVHLAAPSGPVPSATSEDAARPAAGAVSTEQETPSHTQGRIDSTAFRRGVRAFKTGRSNPYNGPELRDEWDAGRAYAARKAEMPRAMAAVDATYCPEYMADAAIAKATRSAA